MPRGDVDEVQALLDSKINVNEENYDCRTPLHLVSNMLSASYDV